MDVLAIGIVVGTASLVTVFGRWVGYRLSQVTAENKETDEALASSYEDTASKLSKEDKE